MDIIILGSGTPMPDPYRAGPSTLVRVGQQDFLFDCGRGVLMRGAAVGMAARDIAALFVTHMHSDHITDYNDVITTRWVMSPAPRPLRVYGPVGFQAFTDATLAMLGNDIGYRIAHHDDLNVGPQVQVTEVETGVVYDEDGVKISAYPTDHSPVHPTVGFRIEAGGKVAAIAGDTVPCDGLTALCQGADVYVQTVIRRRMVEMVPMQRLRDILDYHSDVEQAAQTAATAGVRALVLNHCVPAPAPGSEGEWIAEAKAHFDGEVYLADDLFRITA